MLSIIIPYIRPIGKDRCIESIYKNAGIPETDFEIVAEEDVDRIGSNKMIRNLTYKSKYDIVLFLADDTTIEPNCVYEALEVMKSFDDSWGAVGLNDQFNNPDVLATHWMAHKKLLDYLGGEFLHTGYRHCWSDQEFILRCKEINRFKPAYKAIFNHHHPVIDKRIPIDKDYSRIYSPPNFLHDKMLFMKRKKDGFK